MRGWLSLDLLFFSDHYYLLVFDIVVSGSLLSFGLLLLVKKKNYKNIFIGREALFQWKFGWNVGYDGTL